MLRHNNDIPQSERVKRRQPGASGTEFLRADIVRQEVRAESGLVLFLPIPQMLDVVIQADARRLVLVD